MYQLHFIKYKKQNKTFPLSLLSPTHQKNNQQIWIRGIDSIRFLQSMPWRPCTV